VCEANTQQFHRDFITSVWKEAENMKYFTNRITRLAADMHLGDNITHVEVLWKMLQVVPEHMAQVSISFETLFNINIFVEEVVARRRVATQADDHHQQPGMIVSL
jgi:hypothetical protein